MKEAFSVIPARGGSKGIPKKNVIELNGKPLLAYAIEASMQSEVTETWVSTDCDEIIEVARAYGARVLRRPPELCEDHSTSEEALLHFVENVREFEDLVFIQATCPFILAEDINQALRLLQTHDSVISVTKTDQFFWVGKEPQYDVISRKPRQCREQVYIETGSIFATGRQALIESKVRISGNIGFVEVPKWRAVDIDTADDLVLAQKLMSSDLE